MLTAWRLRQRVAGQGGFTMVELMVAMATGLVIVFAAFALIDLATRTTEQVRDRVDATTQGRAAMENLVQELNSGCVTGDISPIQSSTSGPSPSVSTNGTNLVFVSGLGQSGTIDQSESVTPVEHVVSLNSNGTLTDTSYAWASGNQPTLTTAPTWTFSSKPLGTHVLLTNAAPQTAGGSIFQYFSFSNPSNTTGQSLVGAASITTFPLDNTTWPPTAANSAASIAEVDIALKAAATNKNQEASRAPNMANIDDSVVFRLTPASPGGPNYPCD
jgi:prepilin-type N-terminal cleavage/methylation domain-containing protein